MAIAAMVVQGCDASEDVATDEGAIVGGKVASPDDAVGAEVRKHTVLLTYGGAPYGSGVLVGPTLVLTAAHCLYERESAEQFSGLVAMDQYRVSFGDFPLGGARRPPPASALANFLVFDERGRTTAGVSPPRFDRNSPIDLAWIRTSHEPPSKMEPVDIVSTWSEVLEADDLIGAGYGMAPEKGELGVLRYVILKGVQKVDDEHFRIRRNANKGECFGDSGGPLFVKDATGKRLKLAGIFYAGTCGSGFQDFVFAGAPAVTDWLAKAR